MEEYLSVSSKVERQEPKDTETYDIGLTSSLNNCRGMLDLKKKEKKSLQSCADGLTLQPQSTNVVKLTNWTV